MKLELTTVQSKAVNWLCDREVGYLIGRPGAGKTVVFLSVLQRLLASDCERAIVFAPPAVVGSAWLSDAKKWLDFRDLDLCVLSGTPAQRLKLLEQEYDIYIVSDNIVDWLIDTAIQQKINLGDVLVIDEITRWSAAGSVRVGALNKWHLKHSWKHKYVCTATPVSESWSALYAHFRVLDGGARLGTNKESFLLNYFQRLGYQSYKHRLLPGTDELIMNKIRDTLYELPFDDELLPPLRVQHYDVPLPVRVYEVIKELKKDKLVELGGVTIIAQNSCVLLEKCAQIACGGLYKTELEDGTEKQFVELHREKIAFTQRLVREMGDENVVIVYTYQFEEMWLQEVFSNAIVLKSKRGEALDRAINRADTRQNGRVVLLHPRSAGHGVDGLQDAYRHMIWLSPPWSRESWTQTVGRLWRRGQKSEVHVNVLRGTSTVDEVKWGVVEGKGKLVELFDKYLKTLDN